MHADIFFAWQFYVSLSIFPDSYEGHLKAVSNLYTFATGSSYEELCNYLRDVGEKEFNECQQEVKQFIELAGPHINQAKQAG